MLKRICILFAGLAISGITAFAEHPTLFEFKDLNPTGSSTPENFFRHGNIIYFSARDDDNGRELWKTNGKFNGTVMIKDLNPNGSSDPREFVAFGDSVCFLAEDSTDETRVWISDGTSAGTALLWIDNGVNDYEFATAIDVAGTDIYFSGTRADTGREIWRSDGTAGGTVLVKDINPGVDSSFATELEPLGDTLLFLALSSPEIGGELWRTDGTEESTTLVADINPNGEGVPIHITNVGDVVFFNGQDSLDNQELWKSDGTESGTVLVRDINESPAFFNASVPTQLTRVNDELFFRAAGETSGFELFKSDGTEEGTVLVKDINPASPSILSGGSDPEILTAINGLLYFRASDGTTGIEPYVSDGTEAGTVQLMNGIGNSFPTAFWDVQGYAYFLGGHRKLWRSDGTPEGTEEVPCNCKVFDTLPADFAVLDGRAFFSGSVPESDIELWSFNVPPIVESIALAGNSPTNLQSVDFVVTFSEDVNGVGASDFTVLPTDVTGASVTGVAVNKRIATVTVDTGTGDGMLGLALIDDDSITDDDALVLGGLGTEVGDFEGTEQYTIDKTAPTVTLSLADLRTGVGQARIVDVDFSESVSALALENFVAVNGTPSSLDGADDSYTLTLTPTASGEVTLQLPADSAEDTAGNGNSISNLLSFEAQQSGDGEGEGQPEAEPTGDGEGQSDGEGNPDGEEGEPGGEGAADGEGQVEAEPSGDGEGQGGGEGSADGEGSSDGEVDSVHSADQNADNMVNLSELLRVIQFFNSTGFGCEKGTEDGYAPNDPDQTCAPHASDYNPQDWEISLSELLRLIQFFNSGGYSYCPDEDPATEDGFCPGL